MKKFFLAASLLPVFFVFPAFADDAPEYTTNVPTFYDNGEYRQNGEALTAIGADQAYTKGGSYDGYSGNGVTVAVIDGEVMKDHSELRDRFSNLQKDEFNQFSSTSSKTGTQVSGIIAAGKNDAGMHGVAYNAQLLAFSMDPATAWETLLGNDYDGVKIVHNGGWTGLDDTQKSKVKSLAAQMAGKGKLLIAPAGDNMSKNPNSFLVEAVRGDASIKNNVINVVAYNPEKNLNSAEFISSFSNLAGEAKKWTLAAPGSGIYSTVPYETDASAGFENMDSTSAASAAVSGAAALVQEAFPYLNGKQIADVLFSTAFKKDVKEGSLRLNSYLKQTNGSDNTHYYIITDLLSGTTVEQVKNAIGECARPSVTCEEVTFEEVFGQGLLNVGSAVKGIKTFDANRLTPADFDTARDQFFYSVDTAGKDSSWGNPIGQETVDDADSPYHGKNVGLKKQGEGVLSLTEKNTFKGISIVEGGELRLTSTGELQGGVTVNAGGKFSLSGKMSGGLTVNENASFELADGGTLDGDFENKGTATAIRGTAKGDIVNNGTFVISGKEDPGSTIPGDFSVVSGKKLTNNKDLSFTTAGVFKGILDNQGSIVINGGSNALGTTADDYISNSGDVNVKKDAVLTGKIVNNANGSLYGSGKVAGTVENNGSVTTSLTIAKLENRQGGQIVMTADETGGAAVMQVTDLDIDGGSLTIANDNISYDNARTYELINYNTLNQFENFETETMLTDFVKATVANNSSNKSIDVTIDFARMEETSATSSFAPEEKTVAGIIDKMYMDNHVTDFKGYYYLSGKELQKQINIIRSKAKPVKKEMLPLTNAMTSGISSHLFQTKMNRDAASFRRGNTPMQHYRGKYFRGRSGGDSAKESKVWGQFLGGRVVEDGDSSLNKGDTKTRTVGGMVGYDHEFSPRLLVGVTAGYASGRLTQDSDEIDVNDYRAGIYTGSRFGRLTLNSMLTGGFQEYKSRRYTELAGAQTVGRAEFNGWSAEFDIDLGYDLSPLPYRDYSFYLRPHLAANVSYIAQDSYKEKGASETLIGVDSSDNTSVSVSPGITIGYTFSQAVLTADFGYSRILSGDSVKTSAYFLADTAKTAFDSVAAETDKDYFNAGIGLKTNLSRDVDLNLWAGTRISDNTEALNFAASLSWAF